MKFGRIFWITLSFEVVRCLYSLFYVRDIDFHCYHDFAKRMTDHLDLDYRNYHCDYGKMYYPSVFIYVYSVVMGVANYQIMNLALLHIFFFLAIFVLSWVIFSEYLPSKLLIIIQPIMVQTVYKVGISFVSNDVSFVVIVLAMLYGVKYKRWWISSFSFSLAVSYKMNGLFYGPSLLTVYLALLPFGKVVLHFAAMGALQVIFAAPFLLNNWRNYIAIAFNFSRKFDDIENIAFTFLGDGLRSHPLFLNGLLVSTVFSLISFCLLCFFAIRNARGSSKKMISLLTLIGGNFICFVFVRGVHVQFSLWIWYSMPFLLSILTKNHYIQVTLFMLLDWSLGHPRHVIHLIPNDGIQGILSHIFSREEQSLFGRIPNFTHLHDMYSTTKQLYRVVGHYYEEAFGWKMIPGSMVLFVIEWILMVGLFKFVCQMIRKGTKHESNTIE